MIRRGFAKWTSFVIFYIYFYSFLTALMRSLTYNRLYIFKQNHLVSFDTCLTPMKPNTTIKMKNISNTLLSALLTHCDLFLLLLYIILHFPELYIIMQNEFVIAWFCTLSLIILRLIHVVACIIVHLIYCYLLFHCMDSTVWLDHIWLYI